MIPSLLDRAEAETRAALDGVVEALEGPPLDIPLALVPLRIYGDALRLGIDAPKALRKWAESCGPSLLDDVLRAAVGLLDPCVSPPGVAGAAFDPAVASSVVERDHVESLLRAVRRAWLPRPMTQLSGHAVLVARLAVFDRALAAVVSRTDVTRILDARAALGPTWAEDLPDQGGAELRTSARLSSLRTFPPSSGVVARYVEGGRMQKLVEGVARANAIFAEELALAIDATRTSGQVGFAARTWQRQHARGAAANEAWTFRAPPFAYAAASDAAGSVPGETHRLGRLFGQLDADAKLIVGAREVTLTIDFAPGALATVSLGSETRTPAPDDDRCEITVARASSVVLRVTARSGETVSEELSFVASQS